MDEVIERIMRIIKERDQSISGFVKDARIDPGNFSRKGRDEEHFTLHAYNKEYEEQEFNNATIIKIFKVLGALKTM